MKRNIGKYTLKLLALVLAALMSLCSCGEIVNAASGIVSSVISSAGGEISSAIFDGLEDFSDGINDIKEGISEASSGINEAGNIVSEKIGDIGSKVSDGINNAISEVSEKAGDIVGDIGSELSEVKEKITPSTSVSSDDTTQEPQTVKQYTFRNQDRFDEHYEKHGAEFGDITKEQYLELANELINSTSENILHKDGDSGDKKFYDPDKNYFLVLSGDGYIRTFFMPSAGMKYWEKQ